MSRVGKKPIELPKGVDIDIDGSAVTVKGPKGELKRDFNDRIQVVKDGGTIELKRQSDEREDALFARLVARAARQYGDRRIDRVYKSAGD